MTREEAILKLQKAFPGEEIDVYKYISIPKGYHHKDGTYNYDRIQKPKYVNIEFLVGTRKHLFKYRLTDRIKVNKKKEADMIERGVHKIIQVWSVIPWADLF